MQDAYKVLGLSPDSSEAELRERYNQLKAQYGEQRFKSGEEGNEGARKLMELEDAWAIISADLDKRNSREQFGGDYGAIDRLIKDGKYDEAQRQMDAIADHSAEWHYYQSIIYYKRDWLVESRKQLAMAVSMDPDNKKYSEALARLDTVMANPTASPQSMGSGANMGGADPYATQNTLCQICQCMMCLDCCCRCCGR